jgi:hypothetical protein
MRPFAAICSERAHPSRMIGGMVPPALLSRWRSTMKVIASVLIALSVFATAGSASAFDAKDFYDRLHQQAQ